MGSPLAALLALRGIRPQDDVEDHVLPKSVCKRLMNIYHPADPVVRNRDLLRKALDFNHNSQLTDTSAVSRTFKASEMLETIM